MPLYACPNCGLTEAAALGAPDPGPCPRCCARLAPAGEVSWQHAPPLPFPADRPRIRLALAPSMEAPTFARRALDGLRDELSDEELFKTRLLLSELVANVVKHAADSSPPRATATVWVCPERLRADVLDRGHGFRPRVGPVDEPRDSGWGLPLVAAIADDWGVVPAQGSWVWFELARECQESIVASTRRSARTGTAGESVDASNLRSASPPSAANELLTSSR